MLKLLIVDDMPIIADGLHDLFCEEQRMPLEVYKAYSAPQALTLVQEHRIDIVLSDIKMPEMSGLELLRELKMTHPTCKVLFLTSYHDFEFARDALVYGGSDFILKTEGDSRILDAVYKVAQDVIEDRESRELVVKARTQFRTALPSLQREFLLELLQGKPILSDDRASQFQALEVDLEPQKPVHLVVVRIDRWKQSMNWSDRTLLLYSVRNIMNEYLLPKVKLITLNLDTSHIVGLWQPNDAQEQLKDPTRAFRFFYGTLETIQNTCLSLLKLRLSIVLGSAATSWEDAGEKLLSIEGLMQSGIGLNHELLTTDEELRNNRQQPTETADGPLDTGIKLRLAQYSALPGLLASGHKEEFLELYEQLVATVREVDGHVGLQMESLHYLAHLFLSFMNRRQLLTEMRGKMNLDPLLRIHADVDWSEYANFYRELALQLFEHASNDQKTNSDLLVRDIESYITRNLDQDLSLTRLGEHVHLNPTYLSRLYKQITGKGISDYIMEARVEKAKYLIAHTDKKILEIASEVGYQSGIAFTRFFKKVMNIAPQDYRDMLQQQ